MAFELSTIVVLYAIFASIFVWVNIESQDTFVSSQIYEAVVQRYAETPWSYKPTRHLKDLHSPSDLFHWLSLAFATVTFAEQPVNGVGSGFCTDENRCETGQGDCDFDSQCAENMTCGDRTALKTGVEVNGMYWSIKDVVEYCDYRATPIDIERERQDCSTTGAPDDRRPMCCYDTHSMSYIESLVFFTDETVPTVTANCPAFLRSSSTCCATSEVSLPILNRTELEQVSKAEVRQNRPATVGSFNNILMIRFSMKRHKIKRNPNAFPTKVHENGLYPKVLEAGSATLDPLVYNPKLEDTSVITNSFDMRYEYKKEGSYASAGAYTHWIDPLDGEEAMRTALTTLRRDGWFNIQLGAFTVDMLIVNANVDKVVHVIWSFVFDGTGTCAVTSINRPFNLNLYDINMDRYAFRYTLELVLVFFVICFVAIELRMIWELGFVARYRNGGAVVDVISLCLCISVLTTNFVLQSMEIFSDNDILTKFHDPEKMAGIYADLENLAVAFEEQKFIVAVNLFVVSLRMVVQLAQLQSNFGLIIKVLNIAMYNLLYFLAMFLMIMAGFVYFAYFTFGSRYIKMRSFILAFVEVFSMLVGNPIYEDLKEADPTMAPIFFYVFSVLFYLVMKNMFVSILMTGYDYADNEFEKNKEKDGKKSMNPFTKVARDLASDFGHPAWKFFLTVFKYINICSRPIVAGFKDCLGACIPSASSVAACIRSFPCYGCQLCKRRNGEAKKGTNNAKGKDARHTKDTKDSKDMRAKDVRRRMQDAINFDCVLNIAFMFNFMAFTSLQSQGITSYNLSTATLNQVKSVNWISNRPMRVSSFETIRTFEDVADWANYAIVGRGATPGQGLALYSNPMCATLSGDKVEPNLCNSGNEDEQLINKLSDWNVGFLNTTLVRLTVQPNCFVPTIDTKWSSLFSLMVATPMSPCAGADCMSLHKDYNCLTSAGMSLAERTKDIDLGFEAPGALGPHRLNGGIVVSLGSTAVQAHLMLERLVDKGLFTKNSASMVFDFIHYNGNLDMFIYNQVMFSLLPTGRFEVATQGQVFPMNIWTGGNRTSRTVCVVLFSIYLCLVLYFIFRLFADLRSEHTRCQNEGKPFYYFLFEFYSKIWNISDTVSLALSVFAIVAYITFAVLPFRNSYRFSISNDGKFVIPNADVVKFGIAGLTDYERRYLEEDWFIFHQFETCVSIYSQFLQVAALNSFFISIKVVKYVGHVKQVRIFSNTLEEGKPRIIYFTIIIFLLLAGFALMYTITFGNSVPRFAHVSSSFLQLFQWMVGKVELHALIGVYELVAITTFVAFIMSFYFVAVNMYLATMMNTYSKTVGEMDVMAVRDRVEEERRIRLVEYKDKEALANDLKFERQTHHPDENRKPNVYEDCKLEELPEIIVKEVVQDGHAFNFGVTPGHIIFKVNGQREEFRRKKIDEVFEEGIQEDARDGRIRIIFKDPPKKDEYLGKLFGSYGDGAKDKVPATVKNFWRMQGAVTWIYEQVANAERAEEAEKNDDDEGRGGGEDEEDDDIDDVHDDEKGGTGDDGGNHNDGDNNAPTKAARAKTKKRLDSLLFSRWPDGKRCNVRGSTIERGLGDGPDPPFDGVTGGTLLEEDLDVDTLRESIEAMRVTGEEAWLDCLMTAVEREMDEESIVTEVLRTSDMQDAGKGRDAKQEKKPLMVFYEQADKVLQILEFKARKKYYQCLQQESETRQEQLEKQNVVLHDYVTQLEEEFEKVMKSIHGFKAKKQSMLAKLAGLLDKSEYKSLADVHQQVSEHEHMKRLTVPWTAGRVPQAALAGTGTGAANSRHGGGA